MNKMKNAEAMAMTASIYREELIILCTRIKSYRFHEKALRREVFYDHRDSLATAYRLDNNWDNLFIEAKQIANLIICLNSDAKRDPYIHVPFLCRRYQVRMTPDPATASDEEIALYFRDVYGIIDDFEDMLYEAEIIAKRKNNPEGIAVEM